ncbi:MAG: hypothetical protein KIT80_04895 [Chitinophagaceae bacterium]|nr:hypothetical protein [Chitinophagaceae bacterium]MCW5926230.1 hypothetical protein [Chitinophagaceae bacterium]
MKRLRYLLLGIFPVVVFTATLSSCKKDKPEPATLVGLWEGKYSEAELYPINGYMFLFRGDGTVRVFNGTDTTNQAVGRAEGIYSILGSTVTTKYTYVGVGGTTFSTRSTVNTRFTFQEGTWGAGENTSGRGKFFLVKQ